MASRSRYADYKAVVVDGPNGTRRIRLFPPANPRLLNRLGAAAKLPRGPKRSQALRKAVVAAYQGGHTVAAMTQAASVSRQTIYGILHEADADGQLSGSRIGG